MKSRPGSLRRSRSSVGLSAISLFSGAGGLDLAAKRCGIKTVCYVEWDRYAQGVLMSRIADGTLDDAPLWDDVTTFDGNTWRGKVDIVFGGFPCQPHSVAGKRGGASDERNLWPDTMRILRESGAWGFVGENVPGIVHNGYAAEVLADLEREGFCGTPFSNTACAVGAAHLRERVFFVAHAVGYRRIKAPIQAGEHTESREVSQASWRPDGIVYRENFGGKVWGLPIPAADGIFDDMGHWVDRLKCCGNGVVPGEAVPAFEKLKEWAGI